MERKSEYAATNRNYDEFEPISNWKTEQGFETLTLHLPGFRKEQLKVQVTATRKLRVIGERPAGANKWIRFRKEFPIHSNVDVDSIVAKFEGTNLVLKLSRPEPMSKQTSPIGTTSVQPPQQTREKEAELEKQADKVQTREKEKELVRKEEEEEEEEALKDEEKANVCDGVKQDYRNKVNAYKENLGGYVELMKNNKTATMVVPAAAVLLLSLGFYAGGMFTSH